MSGKILITGATGNVGREVVRELKALKGDAWVNANVRIAAFNVEQAQRMFGTEIECMPFDFARPETIAPAFAGIEKMFLLRPPQIADVPTYIAPAIDTAKASGIRHIVFLSIQGVEQNRFVPHAKIEKVIEERGIPYTFLRAGFFMQNLSTTHRDEIRDQHVIALPVGRAKTAFVDARDLGAVAAHALVEPGHENKKYTLTGSEALDYTQIARIMSDVLRTPIRYTNPSIPAFIMRQLRAGQKLGYVLVMVMLYTITRFGTASKVSDETARLLGRAPITFRQFVEDNRPAWAP